jgi:prepilin-type N-terminal cleavage/methylation domain-containing protein
VRAGREGGFTVIELIISLVIVAIIMVGLLTAMRSLGLTEEKLDARLALVDERRVVSGFLDDVLGQVVLRPRQSLAGTPGESTFVGTPAALEWIGVMPARHGVGGLHHFRLQSGLTSSGGNALILVIPSLLRAARFFRTGRWRSSGFWWGAWRGSPWPTSLMMAASGSANGATARTREPLPVSVFRSWLQAANGRCWFFRCAACCRRARPAAL